jgi:hypothetical protein
VAAFQPTALRINASRDAAHGKTVRNQPFMLEAKRFLSLHSIAENRISCLGCLVKGKDRS